MTIFTNAMEYFDSLFKLNCTLTKQMTFEKTCTTQFEIFKAWGLSPPQIEIPGAAAIQSITVRAEKSMYIFVFTHKQMIRILEKLSLILNAVELFAVIILVKKFFIFIE